MLLRALIPASLAAAALALSVAGCDGSLHPQNVPEPTAPMMDIEDVPVWRLQVRIEVGDVDEAGTDDYVWVRFQPGGSKIYLDYGNNDFQRTSNNVYDIGDLQKAGVSTVQDIRELAIGLEGDDGVLLKEVRLYVNSSGRPIYAHEFNSGRWLDTETGYSPTVQISSAVLRGHSFWTLNGNEAVVKVPRVISHQIMESYVEGFVGDYMHSNDLDWADWVYQGRFFCDDLKPPPACQHVVSERKSSRTSSFTIYLALVLSGQPDATVDVLFDLTAWCSDGKLTLVVPNVSSEVAYPIWYQVVSLGLDNSLKNEAQRIADAMVRAFTKFTAGEPTCTTATFDQESNLKLA